LTDEDFFPVRVAFISDDELCMSLLLEQHEGISSAFLLFFSLVLFRFALIMIRGLRRGRCFAGYAGSEGASNVIIMSHLKT
jgi:hypothetical protein